MNIEHVARICHEANRAYCLTLGDTSQLPWDQAPEWQKQSAIKGVQFHLSELEADRSPQPSASHESWFAEKVRDGWKFGPIKDAEKKEHPCLVGFSELPPEQQLKDFIFVGIVKAVWAGEHYDDIPF